MFPWDFVEFPWWIVRYGCISMIKLPVDYVIFLDHNSFCHLVLFILILHLKCVLKHMLVLMIFA